MIDELPVTDDILEITYQANLEKHNRIDGFLTAFAIILFGEFI